MLKAGEVTIAYEPNQIDTAAALNASKVSYAGGMRMDILLDGGVLTPRVAAAPYEAGAVQK